MKKRLLKPLLLMMMIAIFSLNVTGAAFAKSGGSKNPPKNGIDIATAVSMIVKGLDLNLNTIDFIKMPVASDHYTKVKDNAPYAKDFIYAYYNGVQLPKDINPSATISKEYFAELLYQAMSHKGDFVWIETFQKVADGNQIKKEYMNSIQKLMLAKIVTLDSKQKFYPKNSISRDEAANMISKTVKFINNYKPVPTPAPIEVTLTTGKETDAVTKVTLSATVPTGGYGLEITSIQFTKDQALIKYKLVKPAPDSMNAQVITEIKAVTYIPSTFKPVLQANK
ncbi:protease complex subunit PrcB family protein [Paenibacillus agri]|uniref:Protease complex subunit PrcB family protein n=1 Tax=Paenibacillus agri TaxID=2744309 RepID=A0A850EIX3_9BACL|nr:protease complex subunit PrcB family protein [Paenibacillus agri]NUU59367.1 protease complex subunit PrcB family protein [Paenibacillus agri]